MKNFLLSQGFLIAVLVIAILVAIYLWGKKSGKAKALKYSDDLPNSGSGIPTVGTDENGNVISWSPKPLADDGYKLMSGLPIAGIGVDTESKNAWLDKLTTLTNDQLVALYNYFNAQYLDRGYGTLYDWIDDESFGFFDTRKDKIMARMDLLQLKRADANDKKFLGIV